ncbi:MAG: 50S ribosomal protein L25 [Thermoleophilia bacterium]
MKKVSVKVKERDNFGSPESRRLRNQGWIPGVLYGGGNEGTPLSVEAKALKHALGRERGNVLLELTFEGQDKAHSAILKEHQNDPRSGSLLHVDFLEVRMDQPIESTVQIELIGTAQGVRDGGILDHGLRELHIRCLPTVMPSQVEVDVAALNIGDSVRVSDVTAPEGVEILDDPDAHVAGVMAPKLVVEEVPEELEEGAEAAAEGEAPAGGEEKAAEGEGGGEG